MLSFNLETRKKPERRATSDQVTSQLAKHGSTRLQNTDGNDVKHTCLKEGDNIVLREAAAPDLLVRYENVQ